MYAISRNNETFHGSFETLEEVNYEVDDDATISEQMSAAIEAAILLENNNDPHA